MSLEAIRSSVATAIASIATTFTAYGLKVEYDNRIVVDTRAQTNPFLRVETRLVNGEQITYGTDPTHRIYGQIHLAAAVRAGTGRAEANKLLDHFYPKLHRKRLGVVRTFAAVPAKELEHDGWVYYPILVPFYSDHIG